MKKTIETKSLKFLSGPANLLFSIEKNKRKDGWAKIVSSGTIKARKRFSQDVFKLTSEKYIQVVKNEKGESWARLLEKGFIECLKLKLITAEELPNNWVCLVVFDIPERDKQIREKVRHFLDKNYFLPLQKSVWISRFDVSEILSELLVYFEIEEMVRVFMGKEVISLKCNFTKN